MCCLSGFAQEFSVSPSTIESGGKVTVTGSGETSNAYFSGPYSDPTLITYSDGVWRNWVAVQPITELVTKDIFGTRPTSFKMVVTNSHTLEDFTITLGIRVTIYSATGGPAQNVIKTMVSI